MEHLSLLVRQEQQPAGNGTAEDPAAAAAAAMAALITKGDPSPVVTPAIWVMIALATVFLALRLFCRITKSHLWWDDYILIVGWAFLIVSTSLITHLMKVGFGLTLLFTPHMHTVSTTNDVCNRISLALTKTSFAVTLLRVAQGWQKVLIWGLIVSMNVILAVNCVTTWMPACDRVALGDAYEAVLPNTCWRTMDSVIMAMVSSSYSAFVDFVLALLPWKIILSLQMKKHEKVGVAVAMSLGFVAGAVGIVKVVQIWTITGGLDIPYRLSMLFIWGQAEPCCTIIATSIPVLRVLFRDIHRSRYGTSGGNRYFKSDDKSKFPGSVALRTLEDGKQRSDDSSEHSILPTHKNVEHAPQNNKNAIVRTRDVRIEYDARESSSDGEVFGGATTRTSVPVGTNIRYSPSQPRDGVPRAL